MAEDAYTFEQARVRLEEIAAQVRKKDTSLEKSLDLLEEGVRLANLCTEQIDQTQWKAVLAEAAAEAEADAEAPGADAEVEAEGDAPAGDDSPGVEDAGPADEEVSDDDAGAGALEAEDDVPSEDMHAAEEEPPAAEDPDVEA